MLHPLQKKKQYEQLNLSVRYTAFISSAATQAGVAAAASKEANDTCNLDSVTNDSCDFIPVVCESFGV